MDGATAGRADYLAGRKHGHSLKKFERELLATGIGEEEPDFWKIYWNTFVSAYENGWNLEKSRASSVVETPGGDPRRFVFHGRRIVLRRPWK